MASEKKRMAVIASGQVEGVGFRPAVYRLATRLNLTGFVRNSTRGVVIEVQGQSETIQKFLNDLQKFPPARAKIEKINTSWLPLVEKEQDFSVLPSEEGARVELEIPPDIATCSLCLSELLSPSNRRYLHPFINCTNCGPRYTIIRKIPYDRNHTTMAEFPMCKTCGKEYKNPVDRRFHTQPNCCFSCGPALRLIDSRGKTKKAPPEILFPLVTCLLREGKIGAIKGLGGFHLVCDGTNATAIHLLRQRKKREEKPLALMAACLPVIKKYCLVSPGEAKVLCSWQSPIVLLRKKPDCRLPEIIAAGNRFLGFMLPYTPVHHLLFHFNAPEVLVMTSGNFSEEPIIYQDEEAIRRLKKVADFFLLHNRIIHTGCDDSVVWVRPKTSSPVFLRRSRGYVPESLKLPFSVEKAIVACGGQMKNTVTLLAGEKAIVSQHIGDLDNLATANFFTSVIQHLENLFQVKPEIIACDLHPGYLSTSYARERMREKNLPGISVQHHHSHIAACLAENQVSNEKVIGVAFDGTGWGEDETIWGAEFLLADYSGYKRLAHFLPVPLPGGEKAIHQPWRMAAAYLRETFGENMFQLQIDFLRQLDKHTWKVLEKAIQEKVNSPLASSLGRLFDGIACLLLGRSITRFEGQAALELENLAGKTKQPAYPFSLEEKSETLVIDWRPLIENVVEELSCQVCRQDIAQRFHETVCQIILSTCWKLREKTGCQKVALSGGCFQNRLLLLRSEELLRQAGFTVYTHRLFPPHDGNLSLGQAVVAAYRHKEKVAS